VLALQLPQGPEQLTVANLGTKGFVARITCHCCESVSLRVKGGFPEAEWMGFKNLIRAWFSIV
jgi:hypothetical protein